MLSHYYESENTKWTTTLGYQFGHIGNSRLGYFRDKIYIMPLKMHVA